MFSDKDLRKLIVPLVIEQILAVLVGTADTVMVSYAGESAISGVSLVDMFAYMVITILTALATGGAVIVSQYLGNKEQENANRAAGQLMVGTLLASGVVCVICAALNSQILHLLYGSAEESVLQAAETYMFITAFSFPFLGIYNSSAALFRSMKKTNMTMYVSLLMNVINIAGNALLIYGFGMGVIGAALATLIGRVFAAVFILWQNQDLHNPLRVQRFADLRPRRRPIMQILSIGIPSGLENGMFQIGKLCVSSLTSTLGTSAIAANAVANSVSTLANIPGNTMSLAMIPVIGQCLGAGEKKQAQRYSVTLLGIAITGLAVTNAALFFLMPEVVTWFNLSAEASAMCTHVVHWFNLFSIFFWATSFTLPNALRAGGDAKFTMSVSIVSMWLFRVILSYIFVLQFHLGLTGVWFGMFIDWICRSLCFLVRFARGKWMEHKVI